MKQPFRLAPDNISDDTIEALEELLKEAKSGHIIGLAFAAMYKGRRFVVSTAGEARRSPVFTRGMLSYLDDQLSVESRQRSTS